MKLYIVNWDSEDSFYQPYDGQLFTSIEKAQEYIFKHFIENEKTIRPKAEWLEILCDDENYEDLVRHEIEWNCRFEIVTVIA